MKPKNIKMRYENWQEVQALAEQLSVQRGSKVTIPSAVSEAVKLYRHQLNVKKPS